MSKYYTDEFKEKIVELKRNGKRTSDLVKKYSLTKSSINKWVKEYENSGYRRAHAILITVLCKLRAWA